MKLKQGYTHLYFGDGKGKTSAAIGLAVRAKGAGLSTCFIQFLKGSKPHSSEIKMLKKLGIRVIVFDQVHPMFGGSSEELNNVIPKDFAIVKKAIRSKRYDIIILDEILNVLSENYLTINSLIKAVKSKGKSTELVLTGRKAPKALLKHADYITRFNNLSHPYKKRITARHGIEY